MLRNYFKIAWRNLTKNKGFSITNLLGLTIGITCTLFILMWVKDEVSYDHFHANYKNIYQVIANRNFNNQMFTDRNMVLPLADALEGHYPQIKHAVSKTHSEQHLFEAGNLKLNKNGFFVSAHFFDMFSWKFLKGNPVTAMSDPANIMLTKSAAGAFFGEEDPIGKTLKMDNDRNFKVAGVIEDPPSNSSLQFDYIAPYDPSSDVYKKFITEWGNSRWDVYVEAQPGADIALMTKNINTLKQQHSPNDKVSTYFVYPMSEWRLYSDFKDGKPSGGIIEYVRLFSVIAAIVLLIACVNFMNLSTARSEKRAKEVGIRKTLGSGKKQLVIQFFFESMILTCLAFFVSVLAVYLLLPSFNLMVEKQLQLDFRDPVFWIGSMGVILLTGLIAGSYPALYLSSFNPIQVLKGTFKPGRASILPRHILVVGQFMISVFLISATIIVYQQIQHVKSRDMGYESNNLLMIPSSTDTDKNFASIKNDLLQTHMIAAITRMGTAITSTQWRMGSPDYDGKPADANFIVAGMSTDKDFSKTLGIKMLMGHDFYGVPGDSNSVILNKTAADMMKIKNPLGMQMRQGNSVYIVIAVADNFVVESPYKPVDPLMIYFNPISSDMIHIRLANGVQPQQAIKVMETVFKKYNPAVPFEYQFVDKEFGKKFATEELISKISNIFSALAIFICCIGLAGLVSFTVEKRIREIGIRKVLGASVSQLLTLISVEFLRLVLIAFVISVPLSWWFMHDWLQKYDYHTIISIWLFIGVGAVILLLTLAVVSLNTIRAAAGNPVKSLRNE